MDIGQSFYYALEDKNWLKKFAIGAVISAVPVVNFAWVGYITDIMKAVTANEYTDLPEWSDFGEKFVKGFKISIAGLIYALPIIILGFLPMVGVFATGVAESGNMEEAMTSAATGLGVVFACCITIYMLALSFFFPAVHVHFAREGTFKSCFQIKDILQLVSSNAGNYLTAWAVSLIFSLMAGFAAGIISIVIGIIPCLGWILAVLITAFANVWITTVYAHLFGQVGAEQTQVQD